MADRKSLGSAASDPARSTDIEALRAAAARRAIAPKRAGHSLAVVIAHADAVEMDRPTVSPAKARVRPS